MIEIPTFQGAKYHCVHCGVDWEEPNTVTTTTERIDYLCAGCKKHLGKAETILNIVEDGKRCLITKTTFHYLTGFHKPAVYPYTDINGNCEICGSFPCKHGRKAGVI